MTIEQSSAPTAPRYAWTIAAGATFSVAALVAAPLAGLQIGNVFDREEGQVTWTTLFAGVFLTGCFFWWLLLARPKRFSVLRGAAAGVFVAFFSYPVVLLLAEILQRDWRGEADIVTFEQRGSNVLVNTILTLPTTGFAATVIFAAVGGATAWVLGRFQPDSVAVSGRRAEGRGFWRGLTRWVAILAIAIVLLLVGAFALLSLIPLNTAGLASGPTAASSKTYQQALAAFQTVQSREATQSLNDRCHSTLLTHGSKVARVVIYFHGLTSCPAQADELAAKLFARGDNVYIPRIPKHGEADPLTLALADLTAEDLVGVGNESMDIAQGLGDQVVVVGLSAGGTISAWIAQHRGDVAQSISVAPFFSPHVVPKWATHAATNVLLMLPNMMVWWNPIARGNPPEMAYAYPRFATRGLAQVLRLGAAITDVSRAAAPVGLRPGMLLNAADIAVSNPAAERVAEAWRDHGRPVVVETIPAARALPHDLIDPRLPDANTDYVYQLLIEMMDGKTQ